jgi:hypothetical protein
MDWELVSSKPRMIPGYRHFSWPQNHTVKVIITNSAEIGKMPEATVKEFGKIDIPVNKTDGVPGTTG